MNAKTPTPKKSLAEDIISSLVKTLLCIYAFMLIIHFAAVFQQLPDPAPLDYDNVHAINVSCIA